MPGLAPRMVVSGWRESEQPNQRIGGLWPPGKVERRSPSVWAKEVAQRLLPSRKGAIALSNSLFFWPSWK